MRSVTVNRQTKETSVQISLDLDGTGQHRIATGIGFLDHMLTHIAVHSLFDLTVEASGDLHVDPHHTVEDVAIVLGRAIDQVLGERAGIVRCRDLAHVPMDESLAFVAVDLSGRPYTVAEIEWSGTTVGGIPVTLIPHFLESLASTARANIHARVLCGRDNHHMAEALFKALGRALDQATRPDPRRGTAIPSSKGVL